MNSEFSQILEAKSNTSGIFIIKARLDNYSSMGSELDENRVRYSLVKFTPKNSRAENEMLLEKMAMFTAHAD